MTTNDCTYKFFCNAEKITDTEMQIGAKGTAEKKRNTRLAPPHFLLWLSSVNFLPQNFLRARLELFFLACSANLRYQLFGYVNWLGLWRFAVHLTYYLMHLATDLFLTTSSVKSLTARAVFFLRNIWTEVSSPTALWIPSCARPSIMLFQCKGRGRRVQG